MFSQPLWRTRSSGHFKMAQIRPKDLPTGTATAGSAVIFDNGTTVEKTTPKGLVDVAVPLASQAEAEAGSSNDDRMSSLRVKQAIDVQVFDELASTTSGDGSDLIGFSHGMAGGAGKVSATLKNTLWITDEPFGAAGGGADDAAAIQAAIDYAENAGGMDVHFPSDTWRFTSKLTVKKNNVGLVMPAGGLLVPDSITGDAIHVYPLSGANLQGFRMVGVQGYTAQETTSGAFLKLDRCNAPIIDETTRLQNYFGILNLSGTVGAKIYGQFSTDGAFTAFRSGSYIIKVEKGSNGTIPAENHIYSGELRGNSGNNYLNYAVLITCNDGIWFYGTHAGFAKVGVSISPLDNTSHMTCVNWMDGYLDTCETNALQVYRPSSSYSADTGFHNLHFSQIYNTGQDAVDWFCESTGLNLWSTLDIGQIYRSGYSGVNLGLARKVRIADGFNIQAPSHTAAGKPGILVNNASSEIDIGTGVVDKSDSANTPNAAVQITVGVDKIRLGEVRNIGCTTGVADTSVTVDKAIASALTW